MIEGSHLPSLTHFLSSRNCRSATVQPPSSVCKELLSLLLLPGEGQHFRSQVWARAGLVELFLFLSLNLCA